MKIAGEGIRLSSPLLVSTETAERGSLKTPGGANRRFNLHKRS
jgi:hypothetical protein